MAGTQLFTANGTFTLTNFSPLMIVECWGAGGAGGAAQGSPAWGAGGAGGAYSRSVFTGVTANSWSVVVGAQATAVAGAFRDGGPSSFGSTASGYYVYARGGSGASASVANGYAGVQVLSTTAGCVANDVIYIGGIGGTFATTLGGPGGGAGGYGGSGSIGVNGGGGVGGTNFTIFDEFSRTFSRAGGAGGTGGAASAVGVAGTIPGGGGGGGNANTTTDRAGGNGARGQVLVTWYDVMYNPMGPGFFGM